MLKGTHCPYCPRVQQSLQELQESGHIGKLEILNIEENPEVAKELGVDISDFRARTRQRVQGLFGRGSKHADPVG